MKQTSAFIAIFSVAVLILSSVVITADDNENFNSTAMCSEDASHQVPADLDGYTFHSSEQVTSSELGLYYFKHDVGDHVTKYTYTKMDFDTLELFIVTDIYDGEGFLMRTSGVLSDDKPEQSSVEYTGLGFGFGDLCNAFGEFVDVAIEFGERIVDGIIDLGERIVDAVTDAIVLVVETFKYIGGKIVGTLADLCSTVVEAEKAFEHAVAEYGETAKKIVEGAKSVAVAIKERVFDPVADFMTGEVLDTINSVLNLYKNIKSLEKDAKALYKVADQIAYKVAGVTIKEKVSDLLERLLGEELYKRVLEIGQRLLTSAWLPPIVTLINLAVLVLDFAVFVRDLCREVSELWEELKTYRDADPSLLC